MFERIALACIHNHLQIQSIRAPRSSPEAKTSYAKKNARISEAFLTVSMKNLKQRKFGRVSALENFIYFLINPHATLIQTLILTPKLVTSKIEIDAKSYN